MADDSTHHKILGFRATPREHANLTAAANRAGCSVSDLMRQACAPHLTPPEDKETTP